MRVTNGITRAAAALIVAAGWRAMPATEVTAEEATSCTWCTTYCPDHPELFCESVGCGVGHISCGLGCAGYQYSINCSSS